jgi:PhnB protein
MKISTYLTFDGQARDAFTFYQQALGGTLDGMMTFAEAPDSEQFPAEYRERIMHTCLRLGDSMLMAADSIPGMSCGGGAYEGIKGCSVSLHPDNVAEAERVFAALAEGGRIEMPLEKTFWAERFGMLTDRFGVSWMVNCEQP